MAAGQMNRSPDVEQLAVTWLAGVAIRRVGTWRLVQLHVSAAVSDEHLLAG